MRERNTVAVVIPALNEEESIAKVISAIPPWVDKIIVVDNGSTDSTAEIAQVSGAFVVFEPRRGYGSACLAGIGALEKVDIVVFLDADYSDYPEEMHLLVDPIAHGVADLVIGSRMRGRREAGALLPQARFGNWLACFLIRVFWHMNYSDLGPFRAIRYSSLKTLGMKDPDFGWTVEMQIKAARHNIRVLEVPVSYRRRIGSSKISGTVRGSIEAGMKILSTIFLTAINWRPAAPRDELCIFTRYPAPGKTKTRLIPVLGPKGSAALQRKMTEHTLSETRKFLNSSKVFVEIRFEGGNRYLMAHWFGPELCYRPQGRGHLGTRMNRAFKKAFNAGMARVVLVGTDCPNLTADILRAAFVALKNHDLVLGPASDGGYYLIGLRRAIPELFEDIPWGTAMVLDRTRQIATALKLTVKLLQTLDDVDRPEDLPIWEKVATKYSSQ